MTIEKDRGKMKSRQKGYTLVEIMIVVAIIILLAAIAIPNLVRARIHANDTAAIKILKAMSTATDLYASSSGTGNYPADMSSLVAAGPPYITKNYCDTTEVGFAFACTNTTVQYTYVATPTAVGTTGTTTYTITTGGILSP